MKTINLNDKAWLASLIQEASDAEAEALYNSHYDSLCGCSDHGHPLHDLFLYAMRMRPTLKDGHYAWNSFTLDLSDPDWGGHEELGSCSDPEFTQALDDYVGAFIEGQHEGYDYRDDRRDRPS